MRGESATEIRPRPVAPSGRYLGPRSIRPWWSALRSADSVVSNRSTAAAMVTHSWPSSVGGGLVGSVERREGVGGFSQVRAA